MNKVCQLTLFWFFTAIDAACAAEWDQKVSEFFYQKYVESDFFDFSDTSDLQTIPFPDTPYDLVWERKSPGLYKISWQGSAHLNTSYLVFASNAIEDVSTLIAKTSHPYIYVDSRFSYYRTVALQNATLSAPSDILQLDPPIEQKIQPAKSLSPNDYKKSKYVEEEVWTAVYPYLFPTNHPLKPKLDKIFENGRVTATVDSIKEAGFELNKRLGLHVVVARHPELKGFVIKTYVDHMSKEAEWKKWVTRVQAANAIRSAIVLGGYRSLFKVPKKWIYPLPDNSSPPDSPDYTRKNFILIAEDMKLLDHQENKKRYRHSMKKSHMKALYALCEQLGLADSARIHNLPWTKDHRLAFVDTEAFQRWPVKYHPFLEYLNKENRALWLEITADQRQE